MPDVIARAERHTFCRICEASCGLVAEVEDGTVVRLRPDKDHPVSRGWVCAKGTRFAEVARDPARLRYPMVRRPDPHRPDGGRAAGPRLGTTARRATWEEALGEVRRRVRPILEAHGPHAVGFYFGNPAAFNAAGSVAMLALLRALGTRNVYSAGSQDTANKFAAGALVHGSPFVQPFPDIDRAQLVVCLGTNPFVSQSSFVHLAGGASAFGRVIERGGHVVWVDPRRTESAERWGEHVAIRPGTDAWLLLAWLGLLGPGSAAVGDRRIEGLDELVRAAASITPAAAERVTGIPATTIVALAERLRDTPRVALHLSVGVNMGPFGTLCHVLLQALAAVTGNFDREGGLLVHPLSPRMARAMHATGVGRSHHRSRVGDFGATLDTLPGAILADEILQPGPERIRALIVLAGDPLVSIPGEDRLREAFESLDALVSIDLFENATGRLADVLLPATSWLERWDVSMTGLTLHAGDHVQVAPAVAEPPGECRNEARILLDVMDALLGPGEGPVTMKQRLHGALAAVGRLPWPALPGPRSGLPVPAARGGTYLGRGPLHPGRVMRFWGPEIAAELTRFHRDGAALVSAREDAPFLLIGRRRRLGHNAWLHGGARQPQDPGGGALGGLGSRDGAAGAAAGPVGEGVAWLHPDDLRSLGAAVPSVASLGEGDAPSSGETPSAAPSAGGAAAGLLPAVPWRVTVTTRAGALTLPAVARDDVQRGTVVVPHGVPGLNVNAIIPSGVDAVERISGQHRMTGIPCAVAVV